MYDHYCCFLHIMLIFRNDPQMTIRKNKKTVKLFWKEIKEDPVLLARIKKANTIWDELQPEEIDSAKLEELFENKAKDLMKQVGFILIIVLIYYLNQIDYSNFSPSQNHKINLIYEGHFFCFFFLSFKDEIDYDKYVYLLRLFSFHNGSE